MAKSPTTQKNRGQKYADFGISLDDAVRDLRVHCEDAVNFLSSELEDHWSKAERYYNGEVDLEEFEGRAKVVKTETRDAIRNLMPSIMRILMQARMPVQYIPTDVRHAAWVDQQGEFICQLFYRMGGYIELYQAVVEALKLKVGPMKAWWEEDPRPKYCTYTKIPIEMINQLVSDETFEMDEFEECEDAPGLYDAAGYRNHLNGCLKIESIPNYEFFISRNVNSIEMALERGVHGQKALVTVAEAIDMGIEYDDWIALDPEDPEQSDFTTSSQERRGYNKDDTDILSHTDLSAHQFTLHEVYCQFDLRNTGRAQTYKFLLGGSAYTYLHHEEVDDSPYALIVPIPIPHTVYGHSIPDLTINEQDTSTSLLRATVDNAHAANGARIAADPTKTNFDDIMNHALNSPIRKRAGDTLQMIQVPNTGQQNLGLMQYLDADIQNKVGVTKAAQGLDPDALQSTDKNAVMNTIATSQGQTELMVRNIVETGLIRLFRLALRIATRHMDPMQLMKTKGTVIPVNLLHFDPDAAAVPNVGLGTASPQQKQAALQFIYTEQQKYMEKFGPNNPFTSFSQMYHTLEDMLEASAVYNVERYFNIVTPDVEKQWARQQQEQQQIAAEQAAQNQPMDPSQAFLQVEGIKAQTKGMELASEAALEQEKLRLKAIEIETDDDYKRDDLAQRRVIELAKIDQTKRSKEITEEQADNEKLSTASSSSSQKSA